MAARNQRRRTTSKAAAATSAPETTELPDPNTNPAKGDSQAATGASGADTPAPPLSDAPPAPADNTGTAPDPVDQAALDAAAADTEKAPEENPNVDEATLEENEFRKFWIDYCRKGGYVLPDGHVLFPGEPLTFRGNVIRGTTVELTENVYRMVIPFRSRRPIFTQVALRGQVIPKAGFITKDAYRDATRDLYDDIASVEG